MFLDRLRHEFGKRIYYFGFRVLPERERRAISCMSALGLAWAKANDEDVLRVMNGEVWFDWMWSASKKQPEKELRGPMVKTSDWQPIETAPRDGSKILLWGHQCGSGEADRHSIGMAGSLGLGSLTINGEAAGIWFSVEEELEGHPDDGYCTTRINFVPSHWMPLPAAPAASSSALPDDR